MSNIFSVILSFKVFLKTTTFIHVTLISNIFSVFLRPIPRNIFRYTILDSRVALCNAIAKGRPLLCNTSSKAGALPSEVRIENDSDQKCIQSKCFKVFLKTTFVHVSCYPDHYEPKIFGRLWM